MVTCPNSSIYGRCVRGVTRPRNCKYGGYKYTLSCIRMPPFGGSGSVLVIIQKPYKPHDGPRYPRKTQQAI